METSAPPVLRGHHRVEHITGMPIGINVRDTGVDPVAPDRAFDWFRWVDATFSTYKPYSEISRLNRGEWALASAHPDVRAILQRCDELRKETGGYFDAASAFLFQWERLGDTALRLGAVDPSGVVKGWAVDRAAALLESAGAHNYSINAGGDRRVRGYAALGRPWRTGIQHPTMRDWLAAVVVATDTAIATPGSYERGLHIVDPHTATPPEGVLSVTIVGPDLATTDAYATAAYAMGRSGPDWTAGLPVLGYEAMTILDDATVLTTPEYPATAN